MKKKGSMKICLNGNAPKEKVLITIPPWVWLVLALIVWAWVHSIESTRSFGGIFSVLDNERAWNDQASVLDQVLLVVTTFSIFGGLFASFLIISLLPIIDKLMMEVKRFYGKLTIKVLKD